MILYFSGTGNSRAVALTLGGLFGEKAMPITPSMRGAAVEIPGSDRHLIWAFPIYSWGVPPYVLDIIGRIEITGNSGIPHHAVMTCGDDCGLADKMWRKAITSRGWEDSCAMSVQMPNTYVAMKGFDVDPERVMTEKLSAYPARVKLIADAISRAEQDGGKATDVMHGSFAWIKTHIIYPWFVRHAMNPKRFRVSDACVSCGLCSRRCPLGNIAMHTIKNNPKALRPAWGKDCAGCLRCYHTCPIHAISYTRSTIGKGQYLMPES